jgi:hypothetical protein
MNPFAAFAPVFLAFELWQLVISERYMGIKQIRANADPRELPMAETRAALWGIGLLLYGLWMFTLLLHPVGRAQGIVLLVVTGLGYAVRSSCGIKWVLVVLTLEGSVRVGMLVSLLYATIRHLAA